MLPAKYIPIFCPVLTASVLSLFSVSPNNLPNCSVPLTKDWLVSGDVYSKCNYAYK